jgi:hypothetical protein
MSRRKALLFALLCLCVGFAFSLDSKVKPNPKPKQKTAAAAPAEAAESAPEGSDSPGSGPPAASAKIAISLDLFPLARGIIWSDSDANNSLFALVPVFEYLVYPHFTVGAAADLYFGKYMDIGVFYLGLALHGRYYPLSEGLEKFFIDAGLGFNALSYDGSFKKEEGGFSGMTLSLRAGYKLMFTDRFFVEPSMGFVYAKTGSSIPTPSGWQPGLNIGFAF